MARSQLEVLLGINKDNARRSPMTRPSVGPEDADAHISLARRFGTLGELDKAVTFCQRGAFACAGLPLSALTNLGNALKGQGKRGDGRCYYRKALAAKPDFPDALVNPVNLLHERGELDERSHAVSTSLSLMQRFEAH